MATVTTLAYKDVKTVMTKSSLPVGGFSVNPYVRKSGARSWM